MKSKEENCVYIHLYFILTSYSHCCYLSLTLTFIIFEEDCVTLMQNRIYLPEKVMLGE